MSASQEVTREAVANRIRAHLSSTPGAIELAQTIPTSAPPITLPSLPFAQFSGAPPGNVADLLTLPDEAFVRAAYNALLGREVDPGGLEGYLDSLRTGRLTKSAILAGIHRSQEGREKNRSLAGLERVVARERLAQIPLLGSLLKWGRGIARAGRERTILQAQIDRFVLALGERDDLLAKYANQLQADATRAAERISALEAAVEDIRAAAAVHETRTLALEKALLHVDSVLSGYRDWLERLTQAAPGDAKSSVDLSDFYARFEDAFRGEPEEVLGRLKMYDRWLDPNWLPPPELPVLEIGCGRGLWLKHCNNIGITAYGVDINGSAVDAARAAGVDARREDALLHLRALPSKSVRAIACFHVVEHLPFEEQYALLTEAARTLAPGGLLLIETPNPYNLIVGACLFWSDPSHLKPVFPATLEFAAKDRGFVRTEILQLHRFDTYDPSATGTPVEQKWLFGEMDYALIAYAPEASS